MFQEKLGGQLHYGTFLAKKEIETERMSGLQKELVLCRYVNVTESAFNSYEIVWKFSEARYNGKQKLFRMKLNNKFFWPDDYL